MAKTDRHVRKRKMFLLSVVRKWNLRLRRHSKIIPRKTPNILPGPTRIVSIVDKGKGNGDGGGGEGANGGGSGKAGIRVLAIKMK